MIHQSRLECKGFFYVTQTNRAVAYATAPSTQLGHFFIRSLITGKHIRMPTPTNPRMRNPPYAAAITPTESSSGSTRFFPKKNMAINAKKKAQQNIAILPPLDPMKSPRMKENNSPTAPQTFPNPSATVTIARKVEVTEKIGRAHV